MKQDLRSNSVTAKRPQPQAQWMCGYMRAGRACERGPDANGRCCLRNAELDEQETLIRDELGPCAPERTSWFSRQTLAINIAILVGGVLLLLMAIPQREQVFVPGSLSKPHAQILGNRVVSQRCSLCHPNANAIAANLSQQDLCLNCHAQQMPDAHLGNPHDLNHEQLRELLRPESHSRNSHFVAYNKLSGDSDKGEIEHVVEHAIGRSSSQPSETRCAACHIEHRGGAHDLKAITNARCQSCHSRQFASFADGHPDFQAYPYTSQRRIAFDHQAHASEYFPKKQTEFACATCHVDSQNRTLVGNVFRGVGFEKACASCHQESIKASIVDGWTVLQVPCIAPEDKQDKSQGLGDWPKDATFDYDGELSVVMRLLLLADPECREALSQVPASGKLAEVNPTVRAKTIRTIALAFRRLIQEVAAEGQLAWQSRLSKAAELELGRALNEYEEDLLGRLGRGLPPDLFRTIEKGWFAQAETSDVAQLPPSNSKLRLIATELRPDWQNQPTSKIQLGELQGAEHLTAGGFYLDSTLLTLRYMPQGHADPFLSNWNEFVHHLATAGGDLKVELKNSTPGGCIECHLLPMSTAAIQNHWEAVVDTDLTDSEKSEASRTSTASSLIHQSTPHSVSSLRKWQSVARSNAISRFTKFDHTPHLTLPTLANCTYCHQMSPRMEPKNGSAPLLVEKNDSSDRYHRKDGSQEFIPMRISQCSACHRPGGANDGCTQCHNYHVGTTGFEASR